MAINAEGNGNRAFRFPFFLVPLLFFLIELFAFLYLHPENAGFQKDALWPLIFGGLWAFILSSIVLLFNGK